METIFYKRHFPHEYEFSLISFSKLVSSSPGLGALERDLSSLLFSKSLMIKPLDGLSSELQGH